MAPIIARTVATFNAENTKGNAVGTRTRRKMSNSLAAYDRIRSTWEGRTEVRPRRVLTSTGKKQRTAAVAILGAGESGSNQALKIGENAMIGIAFAAIASGISASPKRRNRASRTAIAIPSDEPITN